MSDEIKIAESPEKPKSAWALYWGKKFPSFHPNAPDEYKGMAAVLAKFNLKIVKRPAKDPLADLIGLAIALLVSVGVCSVLITASGASVSEALEALYYGAFGSADALLESLVQATPLMFTGLAVLVAFRAKVWNIGAEGQLWMGIIWATFANLYFTFLPTFILVLVTMIMGMIGGALWGLLAAYCNTRFKANIVIITIMLNYVVNYFLSYLLAGVWKEPNHHYYQTIRFDDVTFLPTFFDSRLHIGFFAAIVVAAIIYIVIEKTSFGLEVRAIGENPISSKYKGISINKTILMIMLISGLIAGLAGFFELNGLHHRLKLDISQGLGFTGILIAILGRMNPFGVLLAAIFFGALINGATAMQIFTGVPTALVYSVQGVVLFFVLASEAFSHYRIVRLRHA